MSPDRLVKKHIHVFFSPRRAEGAVVGLLRPGANPTLSRIQAGEERGFHQPANHRRQAGVNRIGRLRCPGRN
jgi:hypothetical protein